MAINILTNTNSANVSVNDSMISQNQNVQNAEAKLASQILEEVRAMLPGQVLSGELVSKDGSSISLLLNGELQLNTSMESDANLVPGQMVSFEVKGNNAGQLVLRPLHTNLASEETITKALDSASVKVSDATIQMVDSLMREGMPINKETLNYLNSKINMYPDADVKDIVMLHKLNMPINEANINQMHQYQNNNQWMMGNISDIADEIIMLATEDSSESMSDTSTILTQLGELFEIEDGVNQNKNVIDGKSIEQTWDLQEGTQNVDGQNAKTESEPKLNITKDNVFDILKNIDKKELDSPKIRENIKNVLTQKLGDKLLMEPSKVADKEYVKDYYNKIADFTRDVENILNAGQKNDSGLQNSISMIRENVDFMNQVNELYNYIQLPLKMADGQANGELYVYARKKTAQGTDGDGSLTALLHLSMETLGNMDIFLKLTNGKLNTDFRLEKEEMIDFIAEHIDELNVKLIKKGYDVDTKVGKLEEKEKTLIDNIKSEAPGISVLSTQTFDARA